MSQVVAIQPPVFDGLTKADKAVVLAIVRRNAEQSRERLDEAEAAFEDAHACCGDAKGFGPNCKPLYLWDFRAFKCMSADTFEDRIVQKMAPSDDAECFIAAGRAYYALRDEYHAAKSKSAKDVVAAEWIADSDIVLPDDDFGIYADDDIPDDALDWSDYWAGKTDDKAGQNDAPDGVQSVGVPPERKVVPMRKTVMIRYCLTDTARDAHKLATGRDSVEFAFSINLATADPEVLGLVRMINGNSTAPIEITDPQPVVMGYDSPEVPSMLRAELWERVTAARCRLAIGEPLATARDAYGLLRRYGDAYDVERIVSIQCAADSEAAIQECKRRQAQIAAEVEESSRKLAEKRRLIAEQERERTRWDW